MDQIATLAAIVSAYLSNNAARPEDVPTILAEVHARLVNLDASVGAVEDRRQPAHKLSVKKSITQDGLISYLDGKTYQTLKRHVSTHGMSMDQYRTEFDLPKDYPSVSARYSERRSALAKSFDLGHVRKKRGEVEKKAVSATRSSSKEEGKTAPKTEKKVKPHLKPKDGQAARKTAKEAPASVTEAV